MALFPSAVSRAHYIDERRPSDILSAIEGANVARRPYEGSVMELLSSSFLPLSSFLQCNDISQLTLPH